MADFLFEVGLEEVPARMLAGAEAELRRRVVEVLQRERLVSGEAEAQSFSTPRRLAVLVRGVLARQEDVAEEVLGPAMKIAYKDGVPGPAAVAFARKAGVDVAALKVVATPKGEYVAATSTKPGRAAAEVLAEGLPRELAAIYWAKNMYWRAGKPERFVRPVKWMVALLGDAVVPVEFGGVTAGRVTFGHRVLHGKEPVEVTPETYAGRLRDAFVEPEVEARRHTIRKALDRVCRAIAGARWREDHALVDKMTHLTEWPSVIAGQFAPEFLALPEEVLVTVMRDHQNEFAVEGVDGKLAPHFLAVLNTELLRDGRDLVRHGNERVLRARFNDARFFWEFDQRVPLAERLPMLEKVTFQKDLGSYAAKSARVMEVAGRLGVLAAERGVSLDQAALAEAARLAKTDLTTELVKEFTELQGEIGGLYGRAQGLAPAACDAIYDQYRPVGADDRIPRTAEGQVLALADKIDTIAGLFGLGMEPTGSKDPFALRRAGNGIVRIVAEGVLPVRLSEIVASRDAEERTQSRVAQFLIDRLSSYLLEFRDFAFDVVRAVMNATGRLPDDVHDVILRIEALTEARSSEDFISVCASFKRIRNIVVQASERGELLSDARADLRGTELEQQQLFDRVQVTADTFSNSLKSYKYPAALLELSTLRHAIDSFFDRVLVFDPEPSVRLGRLRLLQLILVRFSTLADFSEIVTVGQS